MAILKIYEEPDPLLRQKSVKVEQVNDELRQLMDNMLETMYAAPGIGLAAIQVGIAKRVLVIDISDESEPKNPMFFVNPELIWTSEDVCSYREGCLSVPEIYDYVQRPQEIEVKYLDYHGQEQMLKTDGLLATCLQHEMDHLEGILFIDRLSRMQRMLAKQRIAKKKKIRLV